MDGSVLLIALRRLRAPLLVLIGVYAIGIVGLIAIPGQDEAGQPWRMSFFDAFYFMSYTASTIGFGEIPRAFSPTQRLWVALVIYLSVIGWAFTIASILGLLQDPAFQRSVIAARFARRVRALREPFYLVCGFGETGLMLGRAFDQIGLRFVAIDIDPTRVQEIDLCNFKADMPALIADAREPEMLVRAGLTKSKCRGVLAITSDDDANLAVAISVRLLNPSTPVLCRAHSRETVANMASFGTDHIINPFAVFGAYVALAIRSPGTYKLLSWLTGLPGTTLEPETTPPRGRWIVCGHGRFGREMVTALVDAGLEVTIVDPRANAVPHGGHVVGLGTEAVSLREAGIEQAVGLVAGTDDDVNNLSIAMTARELEPGLFVITRQNLQANWRLFAAFKPDINMVASEIVANECFGILHNPLVAPVLAGIRAYGDEWARAATARLLETLGPEVPLLWSVKLNLSEAPAVYHGLMFEALTIVLSDLVRDPTRRDLRLDAVPIYHVRDGAGRALPPDDLELVAGDEILFAGSAAAQAEQGMLLANVKVRDYVLTGRDVPEGWLWSRVARVRAPRPHAE